MIRRRTSIICIC